MAAAEVIRGVVGVEGKGVGVNGQEWLDFCRALDPDETGRRGCLMEHAGNRSLRIEDDIHLIFPEMGGVPGAQRKIQR